MALIELNKTQRSLRAHPDLLKKLTLFPSVYLFLLIDFLCDTQEQLLFPIFVVFSFQICYIKFCKTLLMKITSALKCTRELLHQRFQRL
jgi:hypothetical protein